MTARPLRFGICLIDEGRSRREWLDKCRRAEDLGYDVVLAPDHLNLAEPLASVTLAASVTSPAVGVGTYVLNASFRHPGVLARDLATLDEFTDGRLEIGVGTGYVEWEFERAGVPFGTPASRVDRLVETVRTLDERLREPDSGVRRRPRPPLLVGGHGDRVLRFAARRAEVVSFVGAHFRREHGRMVIATHEEMRERVAYVRRCAGERFAGIELNILSKATILTDDPREALPAVRRFGPHLADEVILEAPTITVGPAGEIAEKYLRNREELGITYVTVMEAAMESFGRVIPLLRGR